MNNELTTYENNAPDLVNQLTSRTAMFCSIKPDSIESKALLFNSMNNPEFRLRDFINCTIWARDLFCETVTFEKRGENGELLLSADGTPIVETSPRIVIIDSEDHGYQCVSYGIFNAIRKIIAIYGEPTWVSPLPLEVKQISKGERQILTLNIAR